MCEVPNYPLGHEQVAQCVVNHHPGEPLVERDTEPVSSAEAVERLASGTERRGAGESARHDLLVEEEAELDEPHAQAEAR
eukprot:scaffold202858_cov41-Tisochrysis_lutea.AAC.1